MARRCPGTRDSSERWGPSGERRAHDLIITSGSGAAESVKNEFDAPSVPTRTSKGSITGVEYVSANITTMPNWGDKILPVILNNVEECRLRMWITNVCQALLSVSCVRDSGHTVTFRKEGRGRRTVKHGVSDGELHFWKVSVVYRLEVDLANPSSGFRRPACDQQNRWNRGEWNLRERDASGGVASRHGQWGNQGPRRWTRVLITWQRTSSLMTNSRKPKNQWLCLTQEPRHRNAQLDASTSSGNGALSA